MWIIVLGETDSRLFQSNNLGWERLSFVWKYSFLTICHRFIIDLIMLLLLPETWDLGRSVIESLCCCICYNFLNINLSPFMLIKNRSGFWHWVMWGFNLTSQFDWPKHPSNHLLKLWGTFSRYSLILLQEL